jgi:hypothetical protein
MPTATNTRSALIHQLADNCDDMDDPKAWRKALASADGQALRLITSVGALRDCEDFDSAFCHVADAFKYEDHKRWFGEALERLGSAASEIEKLQIESEEAMRQAAYALGLAVGIRLAGGA